MGIGGMLGDVADALPGGIGAGRRVVAGEGDDYIEGSGGSDEILADPGPYDDRGGDDEVRALGGDDYVRAFGGDNLVDGGPGDDRLITADGDDLVLGGMGGDELQGGRGADRLHGGPGDDEVRGGEGADAVHGNEGDDRVIGSTGDDLVHGGPGADRLEGREGVDTFAWTAAAEGGDTVLDFAPGSDRMALAGILAGFPGEADLPGWVRFAPAGDGVSCLLQVDPDGAAGPAGWATLALVAGQARLDAGALYRAGDLDVEGSAAAPFAALAYIAGHDDLIAAFGADALAGKRHYLVDGCFEGRGVSFDGLRYVATHGDLIEAFGAAAEAGAEHFIRFGSAEGRERDGFDAARYLANYGDLRAAFGADLDAATRHFVTHGYAEGRTDEAPAAAADFML